MNKLSECNKEQKQHLETDREDKKTSELSRIRKLLQFLKTCIAYLESQPTEEFVKQEVKRIETRLDLINKEYDGWITAKVFKNDKEKLKGYLKDFDVPLLKLQV